MTVPWVPLPDFQRVGDVPDSSVERFKERVPEGVVDLWAAGTGLIGDGFLRVIDPAEFIGLLDEAVVEIGDAVPLFVTAFGDILYWNGYLGVVLLKNASMKGLVKRLELLPRLINDATFASSLAPLWPDAKGELGVPDFDECFGFVPMLVLGGPDRVENLQRVKLREHLSLLVQATGPIPG